MKRILTLLIITLTTLSKKSPNPQNLADLRTQKNPESQTNQNPKKIPQNTQTTIPPSRQLLQTPPTSTEGIANNPQMMSTGGMPMMNPHMMGMGGMGMMNPHMMGMGGMGMMNPHMMGMMNPHMMGWVEWV